MSDTNRVALAIVRETTAGTTPATPAFQSLRNTGQSGLSVRPITTISRDSRSDRQITDLILTGKEAGGDIGMELAFESLDIPIEGALLSDFINMPTIVNVTVDTEISDFTALTDTITVASGGAAFKAKMLLNVTGVDANNNGIHEVASSTGTTVVVAGTPGLTNQTTVPLGARIRAVGFIGASADITATTSGGNALLSTALDFTTLGMVVGQWLKVGGTAAGDQFATAANNGLVRVSAIAANRIDLDVVPAGWATDAGTGKTIKVWWGDYARNGTTEHAYSVEQQFTDHSPTTYQLFSGMEFDNLVINIDQQAVATAVATLVGRDATLSTTRFAGATDVAANTNDVMNASADIGILYENGATLGTIVLSASITVNNALRRQNAVGSVGSVGFGKGQADVQVALNTYFNNKTLVEKVMANTATSFTVSLEDGANHRMVFDVPRMKFSEGAPDVSGPNEDVLAQLTAQGLRHATLGYTMHVQRFHYAE